MALSALSTPILLQRAENLARLLKSCGINGVVLNNVNACGDNTKLLQPSNLGNISATVYPVLTKWALTLYLTPCYAAPMASGMGLPRLTGVDPLDPKVLHSRSAAQRSYQCAQPKSSLVIHAKPCLCGYSFACACAFCICMCVCVCVYVCAHAGMEGLQSGSREMRGKLFMMMSP